MKQPWMVFDLETMSTKAGALVLSMGMCLFDLTRLQNFNDLLEQSHEIFFKRLPQMEVERHVQASTLEWWGMQDVQAQRVLHVPEQDCVHPRDFFTEVLFPYYSKHDINPWWAAKNLRWAARGTHFDAAILADMFDEFNVTEPWKYWNLIDTRSYLLACGWDGNRKLVKPEGFVEHDAKHDVAYEALMLQTSNHVDFDTIEFDR
jgi:hypothetical protein